VAAFDIQGTDYKQAPRFESFLYNLSKQKELKLFVQQKNAEIKVLKEQYSMKVVELNVCPFGFCNF